MKNLRFLALTLVFLFSAVFILNSCKDNDTNLNLDIRNNQEISSNIKILDIETAMDDILLPIGTKVKTVSESQIDIELPQNYKFLLYSDKNGVSFSSYGRYSCTCSATNSCKTFYQKKEGYGCLQSSCSGSCTGTPSGGQEEKIAYGIINDKSDSLLGDNFTSSGNLTRKGYDIFFEYVVKNELNNLFELAFSTSEYKNGEELIAKKGEESTTEILLQYKGIYFSAVVPNYDNTKEHQIIDFQRTSSSSCIGSNGCKCEKNKKCFFGNCVYFCEGCTTCTLSVNEQ